MFSVPQQLLHFGYFIRQTVVLLPHNNCNILFIAQMQSKPCNHLPKIPSQLQTCSLLRPKYPILTKYFYPSAHFLAQLLLYNQVKPNFYPSNFETLFTLIKIMKTIITTLLFVLSSYLILPAAPASHNPPSSSERTYSVVTPNPARDIATIKFYNPAEKIHRVELFNVIGSKIATYQNVSGSQLSLDVSSMDTGVYFYFILQNNVRVSTGRLIVQH